MMRRSKPSVLDMMERFGGIAERKCRSPVSPIHFRGRGEWRDERVASALRIAQDLTATSDAVITGHIAAHVHGCECHWPEFAAYASKALPTGRSEHARRRIRTETRGGVRIPKLPDLIAVTLRTARKDIMGAIDISPAVELIQRYRLNKSFARRLPRDTRPFYRHIVDGPRDEARRERTNPHRFFLDKP